jgi:hypothetical protein
LKNEVSKAFGALREPVKKLGQVGMATGRFIANNHQSLSMLAHAVGDASGNPTLKGIGNAAMIGSAIASACGYGKDYVSGGGQNWRLS